MSSNTNVRHGVARVIIAQNKSFVTKIAKVIVTVCIPRVVAMDIALKTSFMRKLKKEKRLLMLFITKNERNEAQCYKKLNIVGARDACSSLNTNLKQNLLIKTSGKN